MDRIPGGARQVNQGGTGLSSATAYAVLCGGTTATGKFQPIAGVGDSGQILTSNGAGALPSFQTAASAAMVKLATLTASVSATLEDTTNITSTYKSYLFVLRNLVPATDGTGLLMRVSYDNGSTWKSDASYLYKIMQDATSVAVTTTGTSFNLSSSTTYVGNDGNYGMSGLIRLHNPSGTSSRKWFHSEIAQLNTTEDDIRNITMDGFFNLDNSAINGVRWYMNSGNITSGDIIIYGLT